ncbi:hypothetical protein GCM10010508_36850 [Streptomyces naganishii JCM 4654]|uniref:Uncharacterized protein n=1 Tax=Streptomyces naganishii JCM 4654 TaxID=1306179 RepID=A0A918Y5D4_9ACTN|nr:hypothetical protein GCM10010508_36850 [Streptomyces naganishii JCM 4654]
MVPPTLVLSRPGGTAARNHSKPRSGCLLRAPDAYAPHGGPDDDPDEGRPSGRRPCGRGWDRGGVRASAVVKGTRRPPAQRENARPPSHPPRSQPAPPTPDGAGHTIP